jgi:EAL domain-containing protein (putative c-di-GMP-specific phosphodiesterase class I)
MNQGAMNQGARGYQETLLVDTIDRMRRNPEGRKLVHLRLSQMLPQNRTAVRLKILTRMFRALESGRQVQMFTLTNGDLMMIVNSGAQRDINNIIHRIRTLFESDPITMTDAGGEDRFCAWYDLSLDSAMALHAAQELRKQAQTGPIRTETPPLPALSPQLLDDIQKKLAFANVVPFIRDQPVLRINAATYEAAIEFVEFFLSVGELQKAAAPQINILGDRWLFQDLSRTMDMRMLDTVVRAPHAREQTAISLNLNLETVISTAFKSFLEHMEKVKVIVEVQAIDVFTNPSMYLDVQGALRALGHGLLLDGMNLGTLRLLDVAALKPDYAKVAWSPELAEGGSKDSNVMFRALSSALGEGKVIISRCESAKALSWGLKNDISLFQGRFLDSLKSNRRRAPTRAAG